MQALVASGIEDGARAHLAALLELVREAFLSEGGSGLQQTGLVRTLCCLPTHDAGAI